jgi:uncharacterized protein YdhG (YjbR/CyaY superfamily)
MAPKKQLTTIDEYIKTFPKDVQSLLQGIRQTIRKAAPEAVETISYQMPAFKLNDRFLVSLAAWKHHVGMYPIPSGTEAFKKKISEYKGAKSTVRFPLDKPVPYHLITQLVTFRVKEALTRPGGFAPPDPPSPSLAGAPRPAPLRRGG